MAVPNLNPVQISLVVIQAIIAAATLWRAHRYYSEAIRAANRSGNLQQKSVFATVKNEMAKSTGAIGKFCDSVKEAGLRCVSEDQNKIESSMEELERLAKQIPTLRIETMGTSRDGDVDHIFDQIDRAIAAIRTFGTAPAHHEQRVDAASELSTITKKLVELYQNASRDALNGVS